MDPHGPGSRGPTRSFAVSRVSQSDRETRDDLVAVEEPLEIRISNETLAITMRTPGHDRELVAGFLLAEGVIETVSDLTTIKHCRGPKHDPDARDNTIEVTLVPGVKPPIDDETGMLARRGTLTTSACGVCGRRSIVDLLRDRAPLEPRRSVVTRAIVSEAVRGLSEHQPIFKQTGGCHAASLVTFDGARVVTHEDVGRHNAVDKVIGSRVLAQKLPLDDHLLVVSGRASFEIVQKAFAARIPIVASVSAPSSLAIDLAIQTNITLLGFVRGDAMTTYSAGERVD